MKTFLSSWQTPFVLLLLFVLGLVAADAHNVAVDGIVFVVAIYAFAASTGRLLVPNKIVTGIVSAAAAGLVYLVATDTSPEMGYFDCIPFVLLLTVTYFTATGSQATAFRAIKLLSVAVASVAAWALHKGAAPHEYVKGMFDDSNLFAGLMFAALLPTLGFAAQALKEGATRKAGGWLVLSGVIVAAAIAAHSRGAWVSTFVAVVCSLLMFRKALNISKVKIAGALAVVALVAIPGILSKTESDLSQHHGAGASFNSRQALLTSTLHMIEDHPFAGTGWGTWSAVYPKYRTSQDVESAGYRAHCDYLEAWSAGGVVGLAELLAIPLLLLLAVKKLSTRAANQQYVMAGVFAGAMVLVVQASVNFIFHQNGLAAISGLLIGALYALPREDEDPPRNLGTLVRRGAGALALVVTAYLAVATYFAGVPVDIMLRPRGTEGLVFGHLMNKEDLTILSRLDPMSPIPDFAIAHLLTIAGALEQKDMKQRAELFDEALTYYDKAGKRAVFDPSIPYREALIYGVYPGIDNATRYNKVIAALDAALARNPRYPSAITAYVQTMDQFGHFDLARQRVKEALARAPASEWQPLGRLLKSIDTAQEKVGHIQQK